MSDPFQEFMDLWAPSVGVENAFTSWLIKDQEQQSAYVLPDIAEFRDTSGVMISGRKAWREHLRSTGRTEMGHGDLKQQTAVHEARKHAYRAKMASATSQAKPIATPKSAAPVEPSRTSQRVAERLHGRPAPDRPTLIKIAMEERMRK